MLCNMLTDITLATPVDLPSFARDVLDAAASPDATRWGRKVMLAAVVRDQDVATVQALLLAAHRAGLIQLARVDHVPAEYHAVRCASEIDAGGATYHAVLDVSARDPWEVVT